MSKSQTWYCPRGCNVFDSFVYDKADPPECAACGNFMGTTSEKYDDVHENIAALQIKASENMSGF